MVPTEVLLPPPAPTPPPSSHINGYGAGPDKPSFSFTSGIRDNSERHAYGLWAGEGTSPEGFKHLIPKPIVEDHPVVHSETEVPTAAPLVPVVHNDTQVPAPLLPVPMQKEMLVSTTTNEAPKTPDLTDCDDPLRSVQKYKAYFRIEIQRYQEGLRRKPPTFKATI